MNLSKNTLTLDIDDDFMLFALVSSVRDYRLCWFINRALRIDMARQEDIDMLYQKKGRQAAFSCYLYEQPDAYLLYALLQNKSVGKFLLPELKQFDFLLKIEGFMADEEKDHLLKQLKAIPVAEAVFEQDPAQLKNIQNLILQ